MAETEQKTTRKEWLKEKIALAMLIVGLLAIRWCLVEPYVVPTGSMEPTLKPGDRLYALKCAYDVRFPFKDWVLFRIQTVKRGDIILFRAPQDPDTIYVKRAVGIPGDRISLRNGVLLVNGEEMPKVPQSERGLMYDIEREGDKTLFVETLTGLKHYVILDNQFPNHRSMDEIVVPPDHFLAIGDNRDNSHDSRAWGFVPYENLKGKAMIIWFSAADRADIGRRPQPVAGLRMVVEMLRDMIVFTGHLFTGDAYVRKERIGTLLQ